MYELEATVTINHPVIGALGVNVRTRFVVEPYILLEKLKDKEGKEEVWVFVTTTPASCWV